MADSVAHVLVGGGWREADPAQPTFEPIDPVSGAPLGRYPTSNWAEVDEALEAGTYAYYAMTEHDPDDRAAFLDQYAERVDAARDQLTSIAITETGLTAERLRDTELPRTTDQLRQAAAAIRSRSWCDATLSPADRIASYLSPIPGVAVVMGPNNFPFAFNGLGGGDFAAAIATGHPVLAKANRGHPGTTRLLGEQAAAAVRDLGLPPATVQLVYGMSHEDGYRLVADPRVAATAFTGSRAAGLRLKSAADAAGRPIYLEMSSVNPVVLLPGALSERCAEIAAELAASMLAGSGQFCTSPGLLFAPAANAQRFSVELVNRLANTPAQTLLSEGVRAALSESVDHLRRHGAEVVFEGRTTASGVSFPTTLLRAPGDAFLSAPNDLQHEAFGNAALLVEYGSVDELRECIRGLGGSLTGTLYVSTDAADEALYAAVAPRLRERVGRLLNNTVPTGVRVVPSMNHGGPYPATGHPGFSSVGVPVSFRRFAMLQSFDNVDDHRLPPELQAANPLGLYRNVDGRVTRDGISWG